LGPSVDISFLGALAAEVVSDAIVASVTDEGPLEEM
jgi:hypothetical protein